MAEWKLLIVFVLYAWQAYDYFSLNQYGMTVVFVTYSLSIIGLIMAGKQI